MREPASSFGQWLRRRRKALDLTQEGLARTVACSRFAIRKIEADERRPSRRLAERLAEKLAIPVGERASFLAAARSVREAARLDVPSRDSSPFVGRDKEWRRLAALLEQAGAGAGQAVLIAGEPGIGKSRLLAELAQICASRGVRVLSARCYEIERAMPYQPVSELVGQALEAASDEVLRRLAPVSLAEIAALVPAVAERVQVPSLSADFPDARKVRLYRAVVQLFETVSAERPLAVIVDDLQWADDASLEFVHYAARQAARRTLLLACACRAEEIDLQERLGGLVESLRSEPHASLMRLERLATGDAQAMIASLGHPALAAPQLAERLARESDGNPFFLTSLLHALAEGEIQAGGAGALPLPEALRNSVRARLAHLPTAERATLDVAAVLGRRFDFETLAAVAGGGEELLGALEGLVKRRLLREEREDGTYDFSHDKVREVAYREMGGARRVTLHRALAEALERRAGEGDGRLAEHYERGHAWEKALAYLERAAERSQGLFAMRDALHWLDRAVALAEAHPEAAANPVALYQRRGSARVLAGQTAGAVADIQRVIDDARARGDRERARDALIQLGMAYRRGDDHASATQCLTRALADCRAMNDERHAADTLYHLGTVAWSDNRNREAIACHQEAVEICERLGLEDLVAVQAWHGRGEAHYNNLEPHAAIRCYQRSIELARRVGDKSYESENLMMIGFACTGYSGVADYARAMESFESALDIARKADLQWHLGPTLLGMDHVRGCSGAREEALAGMRETLRWLEGVRHVRYQFIAHDLIGHLLLELGREEEAAAQSEMALALADATRIGFWRPRIEANLSIARLRRGDLDVGARLEAAAAYCRENSERHHLARCLEGLAELALARRDANRALACAEELLAMVEPAGARELAERARAARDQAMRLAR